MIGYFAVAALALPIASAKVPVAPPPRVAGILPAKTEQAVRQAVYENVKFVIVARGSLGLTMVELPTAVAEAYAKNPGAVLALLLRIAEVGAPPWESQVAIAYCLALFDDEKAVIDVTICMCILPKSNYDAVASYWSATPRQHWIGVVRRKMNAAGK